MMSVIFHQVLSREPLQIVGLIAGTRNPSPSSFCHLQSPLRGLSGTPPASCYFKNSTIISKPWLLWNVTCFSASFHILRCSQPRESGIYSLLSLKSAFPLPSILDKSPRPPYAMNTHILAGSFSSFFENFIHAHNVLWPCSSTPPHNSSRIQQCSLNPPPSFMASALLSLLTTHRVWFVLPIYAWIQSCLLRHGPPTGDRTLKESSLSFT